MGIREEMTTLVRHEGEWEGTYVYIDEDGTVTDRHHAHLTCAFPDDGAYPYLQTNRYHWDDGRSEEFLFPATYKDGRIRFDTERMSGHAWDVDARITVLTWTYTHDPSGYFYEMIHLSEDGNARCRTWHFIQDGRCTRRVLINERRILP